MTKRAAPQIDLDVYDHVYLGEPVRVVEDLGGGWILTEWPDGRPWRQWGAQVRKRVASA